METAPKNRPNKGESMILQVLVDLKEILQKERNYPWEKPKQCLDCNSVRLWGHGFVLCFFDGFLVGLLMKRYRCPDCGTVISYRPAGYFSRFQASISQIRDSIVTKVSQQKWLEGLSRSRQYHWYQSLLRHIAAILGDMWKGGVVAAFDHLVSEGMTPVRRCM